MRLEAGKVQCSPFLARLKDVGTLAIIAGLDQGLRGKRVPRRIVMKGCNMNAAFLVQVCSYAHIGFS